MNQCGKKRLRDEGAVAPGKAGHEFGHQGALWRGETGEKALFLGPQDLLGPSERHPTGGGGLSQHGSTILGIIHPPDQAVGLEPVGQLGHVRPHTLLAVRDGTERQWTLLVDQAAQHAELRQRQLQRRERLLEPRLQRAGRLDERRRHRAGMVAAANIVHA